MPQVTQPLSRYKVFESGQVDAIRARMSELYNDTAATFSPLAGQRRLSQEMFVAAQGCLRTKTGVMLYRVGSRCIPTHPGLHVLKNRKDREELIREGHLYPNPAFPREASGASFTGVDKRYLPQLILNRLHHTEGAISMGSGREMRMCFPRRFLPQRTSSPPLNDFHPRFKLAECSKFMQQTDHSALTRSPGARRA